MNRTVADVVQFLESFAPADLAEDWDNVGLLLGDAESQVHSVMTCLTLTPDVAAEAVENGAQMVVTHHPILFRAVKRLTTETLEGEMLLKLVRAGVAVYSPHTAFDNAAGGINQWLAEKLGLTGIESLRPNTDDPEHPGSGRFGDLTSSTDWADFQKILHENLKTPAFKSVSPAQRAIRRVGIACGSAAEFLRDAQREGCDAFITGEARFHNCLEARDLGLGLILLGHYASERPALEMLADRLASHFPELTAWASRDETDPISWNILNPS